MASTTATMTPLTGISASLVSLTSMIDDYGGGTWNLRVLGLVTAFILWMVRLKLGHKGGIAWYGFIHAIVSGLGSLVCVYLNFFAAEQMSGVSEPLRSVQCAGPLTSLHRILPAITMGYSLFDLLDGLGLGLDFFLHGAATLSLMVFFVEHDLSHIMTPMLLMEVSTIFLTVVKAQFFSPAAHVVNQLCFVLCFFAFRIVLVPYLWFRLMINLSQESSSPEYQQCIPSYFYTVVLLFGLFFHSLNAYWFVKIIKKAMRKIKGTEKFEDNNNLKEGMEAPTNGNKSD